MFIWVESWNWLTEHGFSTLLLSVDLSPQAHMVVFCQGGTYISHYATVLNQPVCKHKVLLKSRNFRIWACLLGRVTIAMVTHFTWELIPPANYFLVKNKQNKKTKQEPQQNTNKQKQPTKQPTKKQNPTFVLLQFKLLWSKINFSVQWRSKLLTSIGR